MPFTWKKVWVWVGLETTRWEKSSIQYRFPRTDNTFSDKANVEADSWVVDTIVDAIDSQVTKQWAEWTIWGQVYPNWIWFFLKALLWNVVSTWSNWIYEHRFTLLESNTHPTLTVWTSTPISSSSYPLAMIESMDFTAEVWWKFTVSINLKSKKGQIENHTVSYLDENWFVANMLKVFLADNIQWLDLAENICLQSITISIKKEIKDIECLSSIDPIDYINSSFSIEWSMEMLFENNTYKDYFLNWTPKALRVLAEDTKHPYEGVENYPTFMLDLSKIIITDWTPAFTIDDVTKQSITFKGHYDVRTHKAIEIYLKNTQPSYDWGDTPTPPEPVWEVTFTTEERWVPENDRYEYFVTRTQWNDVKIVHFYQNFHPTATGLNWAIFKDKTQNWTTTAEEASVQVNILTWNWILNTKFDVNQENMTEEKWNFLWNFDVNTSYIHFYIKSLNDYDYLVWKVELENTDTLLDAYPFTISHDNTLIKHGYQWDEVVAWGVPASNMINYVHQYQDTILYDNETIEYEIREMNRYNYSMNNIIWEPNAYHIQTNHSGIQQYYVVCYDNWEYVIQDTTHWTVEVTTQSVYEQIETLFSEFRDAHEYSEFDYYINIDNSEYNELMWVIDWDTITEDVYEWTD